MHRASPRAETLTRAPAEPGAQIARRAALQPRPPARPPGAPARGRAAPQPAPHAGRSSLNTEPKMHVGKDCCMCQMSSKAAAFIQYCSHERTPRTGTGPAPLSTQPDSHAPKLACSSSRVSCRPSCRPTSHAVPATLLPAQPIYGVSAWLSHIDSELPHSTHRSAHATQRRQFGMQCMASLIRAAGLHVWHVPRASATLAVPGKAP